MVAQLARALPCHGRGRGFESRSPRPIRLAQGVALVKDPCAPPKNSILLPGKEIIVAKTKSINLEVTPKKISWGDSYMSLLLGMVVVVVVGFIVFSFAKNKVNLQQTSSVKDDAATQEQTDSPKSLGLPKTYTVVAGDNLWSISEKIYKSGYNWVDIAKANNLANPGIVHAGVKLTIPDVKPIIVATAQQEEKVSEAPSANAIKGNSYTVVSGDNLWDIAVRAYSDGYRFVEIAKANNLSNPDIIFSGNKLTIPR